MTNDMTDPKTDLLTDSKIHPMADPIIDLMVNHMADPMTDTLTDHMTNGLHDWPKLWCQGSFVMCSFTITHPHPMGQ